MAASMLEFLQNTMFPGEPERQREIRSLLDGFRLKDHATQRGRIWAEDELVRDRFANFRLSKQPNLGIRAAWRAA